MYIDDFFRVRKMSVLACSDRSQARQIRGIECFTHVKMVNVCHTYLMCENNVFSLVLYKGNHFLLTFSRKTYPKVAKLVEISCETKQFGILRSKGIAFVMPSQQKRYRLKGRT